MFAAKIPTLAMCQRTFPGAAGVSPPWLRQTHVQGRCPTPWQTDLAREVRRASARRGCGKRDYIGGITSARQSGDRLLVATVAIAGAKPRGAYAPRSWGMRDCAQLRTGR
ncbi:hypothetical protein HRbin36_01016 [bacterium HR36]|nr:hypothetical protein HRbin36_01016 [bacterium HR36]